ncbi:transforming growth factor-beta-induced protein ig-h3 [Contarinia nasturtii]|uniref:transforming growth factor-beta-induced protein ig-h3 n=1 Tax=Contarinia nasturtii TaxID=265458 RepID=UPI0012D3A0A1|nr:transforming growth factor-beta-induced protein ig-h3 [Contarinia nasturtii]XP_031621153.1 transforming growth factor-beta-induced protein ig-h3 [Contarinia nasturtii]
MRCILTFLAIALFACTAFGLEFEDERRDLNYGWREPDESIYGFMGPKRLFPKSATRREGVESSEEDDDSKDSSESPLGLDVVSGTIGESKPSISGGDSISFNRPIDPFFSPFFNVFNLGFPGFDVPQSIPWWRGPNVCTERKEEISDWNTPAASTEKTDESTETRESSSTSITGGFHFSFNTCVEKANKRTCKTVVDEDGRKKTKSVTQQCCRGYGRKKNSKSANIYMPCEELHLRSLIETSERLNGREFIRSAQKNDIDDELRKNVTLFLPNDATFTEFAEQLLESNLVVLPGSRARRQASPSGLTTKSIIMNHIVPEIVNIEDVENEQLLVTAYDNATIRMNIFPRPPGHREEDESPYRYTANCAPISKADQEAENGIVHVVDRVLLPVTKSLMELVRERSDMAVLQTVLDRTDLAKQLENKDKQFTLFAPTDKAFEKLDPHVRRTIKDGKGCALNILKNHILDMTFCSVAVVEGAKTSAINTMGERMDLERIVTPKASSESPSEAEDLAESKNIVINGKSQITETDIMATNGVMHIVDSILETDSSMPLTSMLESRNLTYFKTLIQLNGIDDLIDSYENVSVFAPTDAALESNEWVKKIDSDPDSLKGNEELTKFLKYHIAKPLIKTCDLSERSLDTESGDKVRVNLYSTHSLFSNVFNRATINCARLVHFDDDSCGSVLHQVDKPLTPPTSNLMEALKANEQYSMFVEFIESANLTSLLENENGTLTVLVPKNDVFTEVKEYFDELRNDGNTKKLENLVKSHIIEDVLCCAGIVSSEWPFVRLVKTINDVDLRLNRDRRPKIQNAGVTKCDILAKNGIIHEINDVINPKQLQRAPARRTESDSHSHESPYLPLVPKTPFHDFFTFR